MKKSKKNLYFFIFFVAFFADRITKFLAHAFLFDSSITINRYLNLSFVFNRGISWGLFSFQSSQGFWITTAIVILVLCSFLGHTLHRYKNNFDITFETLVLSGAVSNVIDRFCYSGVIDFIEFHLGEWFFPVFNIADVCIVVGIAGVIFKSYLQSYDQKY